MVNTPTSGGQILEVLPQESGAQRVLVIQRKDMGLAHRIHVEEMQYRLERFQPAQVDHGLASLKDLGNVRVIEWIRSGYHAVDAAGHGQRHHMCGLSITSSGSGSRDKHRSPNALLNWAEKR